MNALRGFVFALVALAPLAARAQDAFLRQGLQLQGSLGLSDCLGDYCADGTQTFENTRTAVGVAASAWFRPIERVGLGGGLHYNILGTNDQPGVDSSADYFNIDAGARVYPLADGPVDVYAGLTLGYTFAGTSWDSALSEGSESFSGITLGVQAGAEYYFTPAMSGGLLFKFYVPFWSHGCVDEQGLYDYDDCDDAEDLEDVIPGFEVDDLPNIWYLGGTFSYHLAT